jgi:TM2 domain-containing membrane protein YozV
MEVGSVRKCAQCGAPLDENLAACKYCGEPSQIQPQQQQYQAQQVYQQPPINQQFQQPVYESYVNTKSKTTAGILGILLGGLGVHKFYLGRIGTGILYILFCWTYIPSIIGLIEGITYLTSSEEKFYNKYVLKKK